MEIVVAVLGGLAWVSGMAVGVHMTRWHAAAKRALLENQIAELWQRHDAMESRYLTMAAKMNAANDEMYRAATEYLTALRQADTVLTTIRNRSPHDHATDTYAVGGRCLDALGSVLRLEPKEETNERT